MKADVKKLWLEALRSGEYQQGKSCLHAKTEKGDEFCCLGVLCDLYAKKKKLQWGDERTDVWAKQNYVTFLGATVMPPVKVMKWAGLHLIQVRYNDDPITISDLNDDGIPFSTIADLIEEQL